MSSSDLNCGTSLRASSHSSLSLLRLDDDESENTISSRTNLNGSSNNNNGGVGGGVGVGHHRTRNPDGGPSNRRTLLADMPVTEELTLLRRREIEIGTVLGRGRYSEVHSIQSIHLQQQPNNDKGVDTGKSNDNGTSDPPPPNSSAEILDTTGNYSQQQQQQQRQRYVMKHIQNKLFANRGHRRWQRDLTNAIADLVTEAMYLSKLNHPHIIRLRGLTRGGTSVLKRPGANGEDYFLLLDRMEETLDYRIHQRWKKMFTSSNGAAATTTTPPNQKPQQGRQQSYDLVMNKIRYSYQMAQALSYLHEHQIIFRDYKPENCGFVIQDAELSQTNPNRDRLQLFDFGLARELDEPPPPTPPLTTTTTTTTLLSSSSSTGAEPPPERLYSLSASGTRRYMAPEIFNGKQYNYKADVYSWAVVFFETLSHVKPFADFTTQSHEELVCRLGGRPKLTEIDWPPNSSSSNSNNQTNNDTTATTTATDAAVAAASSAAAETTTTTTPNDDDDDDNNNNNNNTAQATATSANNTLSLSQETESLLQRAWNQDLYQRPSMARVCMELEDLLKRRQGSLASASSSTSPTQMTGAQASTSSTTTTAIQGVQQNVFAAATTTAAAAAINISNDPSTADVNMFLQKKTSTSELTSATDPMASDSEEVSLFDDNSHPNNNNSNNSSNNNNKATRWSHSSGRSSISSLGSIPTH